MAISASELAFEGFRLTREKPMTLLYWAGLHLVLSLITSAAVVYFIGDDMAALMTFKPEGGDMEALNRMLPAIGTLYAIIIPVGLIGGAVFMCAVMRSMLRPEQASFGALRFGADEFRQILLMIVVGLIYIAAVAVTAIAVAFLAAGIGMVVGMAGGAAGLVGVVAMALTFGGLIAVMAFLYVRLSLAAPMTFTRGRLVIGEAWRMTRGHFWPLLGAYFISWVLLIVVAMLGMAIMFGIVAATGGGMGAIGQLTNPDFSSFAARFTPVSIVIGVCSAVLNALQYAIMYAPPTLAHRELGEGQTLDTFA